MWLLEHLYSVGSLTSTQTAHGTPKLYPLWYLGVNWLLGVNGPGGKFIDYSSRLLRYTRHCGPAWCIWYVYISILDFF